MNTLTTPSITDVSDDTLMERLSAARRENSDLRLEVTHLVNSKRSMQDHYLSQVLELKKQVLAYKDEVDLLRAQLADSQAEYDEDGDRLVYWEALPSGGVVVYDN